ncbi:MAG TPA: hypothetical protein PLK90_07190 [Clostridiales bacterium]|nr:hypothetical protein [Clostridiales bacterium]HQP70169.1 hypothetical protein [Clostridiales bacterium]
MKVLKIALILLFTAGLFAQETLTEEEKAFFKTNVVVPVPSEIIMALDILSDVNWKAVTEYNLSANYSENYKIALNLGVRVAEGFIAIQGEDRKNTGEMFSVCRDLAENFGAKSEMFVDKEEISRLLNENKWLELRGILDDIQLKVKDEMYKYDADYVVLASVGGWIEGLHIVSKALTQNYTEEASMILYQPELIDYFTQEVGYLKILNSDNPEVKEINRIMPEIKRLTEVGSGNPIPKENIDELYKLSSQAIKIIVAEPEREESAEAQDAEKTKGSGMWIAVFAVLATVLLVVFFVLRKKGGE